MTTAESPVINPLQRNRIALPLSLFRVGSADDIRWAIPHPGIVSRLLSNSSGTCSPEGRHLILFRGLTHP